MHILSKVKSVFRKDLQGVFRKDLCSTSNYKLFMTIDDYAKDGGPGKVCFYVVFTMSLCALELRQSLISLLFQVIGL